MPTKRRRYEESRNPLRACPPSLPNNRVGLTPGPPGTIGSWEEETPDSPRIQAATDQRMTKRLIVISLAVLPCAVFVSSAQAQRHAAFASAPESRIARAAPSSGRANLVRLRRTRRHFAGSAFASPFYPDYDDYDSELGNFQGPPPLLIAQTAQAPSPAPVTNPAESLVLELQGDHWVRLTNYGQSQTGQFLQPQSQRPSDLPSTTPGSTSRPIQTPASPTELPPAVLVFRDGHHEEIGKYVIVGAIIHTSSDYWTTGSWTRDVQIAALNIPATLKLNHERGANFSLPSGPHEVMIRP
jgi:hypothetical protein